jgi:hypothetical protein
MEFPKVTRVEVIDEDGRVYSRWCAKVELSVQDDGRTLKMFVRRRQGHEAESCRKLNIPSER